MRRKRTSPQEQLRLIQACRQSGLTDFDWCQAHGIPPATFYGWIHRLKQKGEMEVPAGIPTIVRKRYINTRIAPKPVQEEAKGEGRALHWRRPPVPFPGSNLPLSPGLFPVRGNRDLNQQVLRLAAQTVCECVQARNGDICIL